MRRMVSEILHSAATAMSVGEMMLSDMLADYDLAKVEMLAVLREEAMQKIEDERWLYEPQDRYTEGCCQRLNRKTTIR